MSSTLSSTAASSHSSTPAFLLSDDYLAADLSDGDDVDALPAAIGVPSAPAGRPTPYGRQPLGLEEGGEDVDEEGAVRLPVDEETRQQLREIQGALSARLGGKPHPSHLGAFSSQRAVHDRLPNPVLSSSAASQSSLQGSSLDVHASDVSDHIHTNAAPTASSSSAAGSSSTASVSSLLSLLASKEADLRLAAQLGEALSDQSDTLQQYCRHLEQQLTTHTHTHTAPLQPHPHHPHTTTTQPSHTTTTNPPSPTHRTSHSLTDLPASQPPSDAETARLRVELGRLERRLAVSEGWHRDALKVARSERREMEVRVKELEREGKRREVEDGERRKRDEEERIRLAEELEQLRAMEQQRLVRERELRRQREQKEKADDAEQRQTQHDKEQAEHRWRDEQRRREELERRCRALEKQRDDANERATLQTKEFEHRRRRWEEERGRAVDDELDRHRSQAKALADQYRAVEEHVKQSGKARTLSVDTTGRLSPSPSSPPLSGGDDGRDRRAVLVSHSTQTPGEWAQRLDRAESEMTIPKGRAENERVLYSPLQFTLLSPSSAAEDAAGKEQREEVKEAATASSGWAEREIAAEDELVIPHSLVTPPRQAVRTPYLSPHSPLPNVVELTEADEKALVDVVAPTIPSATATSSDESPGHEAASPTVSFLSPLYPRRGELTSFNAAATEHLARPSTTNPIQPADPVPDIPLSTPPRRSAVTSALSSFLTSPFIKSPFLRSSQPTPPPQPAPSSTSLTARAASPLLFTLHTAHPSSIRAYLTAAASSAPPPPALLPLSSPFSQLQSSLVKQAAGAGGGAGGAGRRLQPCVDEDTKRVFSVLMQTRMGEGVAGFG